MVEVTSKNFHELKIEECLNECSFVSIDCEFTGLRSGREFQLNIFDTAEQRYYKQLDGSDGMFVAQVGLSFFKHLAMNEWRVSTFNVLISPKNPHFCVRDRYFSWQTSSLELLFKSGFSFDRCFKEGVTYISQTEELECRKSLEQRATRRILRSEAGNNNSDESGRVSNHKAPWWLAFEQNICKKLDEALLNDVRSLGLSDFTDEERSVLLRVIEKKYSDKFVLLSNSVILLKDADDWLNMHLADLGNCMGFTSVVKRICESGKPVIGHNIYLDLIHIYRQFIGPLPGDYEDAKSALHTAFPRIIDTKLLSSMEPLKDWVTSTGLPELYKAVQRTPFKQPKVENAAYGAHSEDHLHQAGYDSYITGYCFISLADKLCQLKNEKPGVVPLESASLQAYFNKVFMFRSWDYNFISLDRRDNVPNRKAVFHVSVPSNFRTEHVLELFKPFGKVQIGWIDDYSCYVGLHDGEQATFAAKKLCVHGATLPDGVMVKAWSAVVTKRKSSTEIDEMVIDGLQQQQQDGGDSREQAKKARKSEEPKPGMFSVPEQW